ncbi:MAG TPA: DNA/RNA non-specific endonuclease [Patescibacteria group bacterium]|nr:DNA/RNA non-specific endonuclease [Patescibacteria group bacterium]
MNSTFLKIPVALWLLFVFSACSNNSVAPKDNNPKDTTHNHNPNDTTKMATDTVTFSNIHSCMGIAADATPDDDYYMTKSQYVLSYNRFKNVPNWVSWNLNASWYGDVERRTGDFIPDRSLPDGWYQVRHSDYTNSGYDRGHMVRSEERTATREDNDATFLMTNILPQYNDMNAGPWGKLENYCEDLCKEENKELYLIAGGIFPAQPALLKEKVAVPDACFKIIVVLERGQRLKDVTSATRIIAVTMPNVKGIRTNDWKMYRTTVDRIEQVTGYDFLKNITKSVQDSLERKVDTF